MAARVQRAPSGCGKCCPGDKPRARSPKSTHVYTPTALTPAFIRFYGQVPATAPKPKLLQHLTVPWGSPSAPIFFLISEQKRASTSAGGAAHTAPGVCREQQCFSCTPQDCVPRSVPSVPVTMQGTLCSVWLWRVWEAGTESPAVHPGALPTPKSSEGPGKDLFQEPSPNPGLLFARQSRSASAFRRVQLLINPPRVNKRQSHLTRR